MRDPSLEQLAEGDSARVAGRLVAVGADPTAAAADVDPTWQARLRDAEGEVVLRGRGAPPRIGDLVRAEVVVRGGRFEVDALSVVARPHGRPLEDPEWRRLADPVHHARLRARARLSRAIRAWFDARGFLEVETGQLVDEPGQEPTLDPFVVAEDRALITSPELRMKRLLAAGHERIYELSHCFRSGLGERSAMHHPEFTMLEWYRAWADDEALVRDLESLLPAAAAAVREEAAPAVAAGTDGARFDPPFERLSVRDAFARHAGVSLEPLLEGDAAGFRESARRAGVRAISDHEGGEALFFRILLDHVEPKLGRGRPCVLWGYPASMAALARVDPDDPRVARRFEVYVDGVELANAFDELTDPVEQRRRFEADRAKKRADGRDPGPWPARFLAALDAGLPPTAGIALGVDRLLMAIVGARRIDEVLAFPEPDPARADG